MAICPIGGCQSDPASGAPLLLTPHNVALFPRDEPLLDSPTPSELGEIRGQMEAYADGHEVGSAVLEPPGWDRLPEAVDKAAESLELAVYGTTGDDVGMTFTLRSIDDIPVELVAVRTEDASIFRMQASAGWFGDEEQLAADLLSAVRREFGALRPR